MDLLDRYLAAIRHNLPTTRAQDITSELRDELLGQIEAREHALGRPLERAELSAIIEAFGPPLLVASRYRERQYLIGPESYPFYLYGLRVVSVIALLVLLFAGIIPAIAGGDAPVATFFKGLERAYYALFLGFAWLTIAFAVMDRLGRRGVRLAKWNPAGLPPLAARTPRGKWTSPIEVGLCMLLLLVWTGIAPIPVFAGQGVHLTPAPVWDAYYWPVLILGLATLAYNLICWLRPNWESACLGLALGTQVGWLWAVASLRADGPWFLATSASAAFAEQAARTQAGVNAAISLALIIAVIAGGIRLVTFVYQHLLRRYFIGR